MSIQLLAVCIIVISLVLIVVILLWPRGAAHYEIEPDELGRKKLHWDYEEQEFKRLHDTKRKDD